MPELSGVWVGVAARLLAPLAKGVESRDMLAVGVISSLESVGDSRMVKSSVEACGAAWVNPGVWRPITSVLKKRKTNFKMKVKKTSFYILLLKWYMYTV